MQTFLSRDTFINACIGSGALILGVVMAITGALCLHTETGTPEYIVSLRNTGLTLIALSLLWLGLTAWKELNRK
jgi:hypothetical protein